MNKKIKQAQKAPSQTPIETDFEDFFTQYLEKKKRNYYKKLDKVALLMQKDANTLTIEQKSMIENQQKMNDEINYYEEIKQHYFKALKKKDPEILKKKEETKPESPAQPGGDLTEFAQKTLALYYSNQTNLEGLDEDAQKSLGTYRDEVFAAQSYDEQNRQKTETSLLNFLKDVTVSNKLMEYANSNQMVTKPEETEEAVEEKVEETPEKPIEQEPVEEAKPVEDQPEKENKEAPQELEPEPLQTTKKKSINKPTLFVMSSDEEDNEEEDEDAVRKESITSNAKQIEKPEEQAKEPENKEEEAQMKIKPLPEDSDEEFGDFTRTGSNNRGKRRRNRNKNKKEQGEGYNKNRRKNKGYKPSQKDGFKQKVVTSYQRKE